MPSRPTSFGHTEAEKKSRLKDYYNQRKDWQSFYGTAAWRKARLVVLARDIICQVCREAAANECDHINPRCNTSPDEWFNPANLQGLCKECHSKKTRTEW